MSTLHRRHIFPQLRLLAPKALLSHSVSPVQHRPQLEHHSIRDEQDTKAPSGPTANVKLQHRAAQPYIPLKSVSPAHDSTSPPLLSHDSTVLSPKQAQHSVVAPSTSTYSNRVPLSLADNDSPQLVCGNLLSGVVTRETLGLPTQHAPYSNLQLQETIQNRQGQDYWIPTLNRDTPEVLQAMMQPTIGVHQSQSSQPTADQHLPMPNKQLPAIQPEYRSAFQPNSQHVACVNCPTVWRSHLESIMLSDPEDKGMIDLKRSYRHLQQHIYEAHQWHYGASCAWCENLVCYHLGKMMLLEAAEGNFAHVKINLGNSFMMLREHIQEAHGGC